MKKAPGSLGSSKRDASLAATAGRTRGFAEFPRALMRRRQRWYFVAYPREVNGPGNRPVLRNRDFLLFWGGQTVSETGSQVTVLALPLTAIVLLRASAFQVGLLSAADTAAYLAVALPAGLLADRLGRRRLMLWCDLGLLFVIGSVPAAWAAGALTLGQLYGVALISGVLSVVFLVAYSSYLPVLVGPGQLMEANGKLSVSESSAQLAGPGIGGLLVGLLGAAGAMTADAASYAVSAACLLLIRRREQPVTAAARPERAARGGVAALAAEIGDGLRYVLREPILRKAAAWSGTANFFVIMVETLGPLFLVRIVRVQPGDVGLLLALGAVGGVAGGLLSGPLARWLGSARAGWLPMTVCTFPGVLIPLAAPGWRVLFFAGGWICWSFGACLCSVSVTSYRQRTCPPEILGRVSAASRWVTWGPLPLGGVVGGALASAVGVQATLWIAVTGACSSVLWLIFSPLRRLRDLPEHALAAPSAA
jgi:MFS family permease